LLISANWLYEDLNFLKLEKKLDVIDTLSYALTLPGTSTGH